MLDSAVGLSCCKQKIKSRTALQPLVSASFYASRIFWSLGMMSAQTVIRVKRRRSEASLDALLLACKRQKCEETGVELDTVTTLVKLAGTVEKLDYSSLKAALENVKSTPKLRENKLKHVSDTREKLRQDLAKKWKDKRYEVVNQFRSEAADGSDEKPLNILDMESQIGGEQEGDDFLYDVYTTTDVFDGVMDSLLSVQPVDLVDDCLDGDEDQDGNESEDSNDENNWRNDYPDEDDEDNCFESADSDEGEEFHGWNVSRKKHRVVDEDGVSLSSDDIDDDYLYGQSNDVDGLVDKWHDVVALTDSDVEASS